MSRPSTPTALNADQLASTLSGALSGYETILRPIEAIAFWAAVVMPFVYLPLLLTGLETSSEQVAVVALVAVHVLSLVVGKRYSPQR
ncbi:putative membrane protein [Halanaeroarchaeum sp. HSR-CO]|uniref:hypothetical protein n=1 Tax=Halanaeroarchaeum sp. HSR-CO TaxID=2866382 RepID=UPI00217F08A1|nr:hypothetical protein [Halanaeroarchaeum sp. HSR-CO]UWG48587.1 putative membrane protein [Halanaeroarchaeum sp. HSR-CO]